MMAAEATQSNPVDAAKTSTEPIITISADSQNVGAKPLLVNGAGSSPRDEIENKNLSDTVDHLVNSAEVSVSGGSDNEAGKDDSFKDDGKGHTRLSSSVKKPISFKSVSVNKTFLGNKGQGSGTTTPKSLEKATSTAAASGTPGSAAIAAARPRLVAKLGATSRDGGKASGGAGAKPAGAPDPSLVWTKNRPPPPVEPKKLTDEELKKYGIHMTARLAPEDTNAANNWADVDDDDDDWIPSEIHWNDGTKVTIPTVDEATTIVPPPPAAPEPVAPAPVPTASLVEDPKPVEKPKSPAPSSLSSSKAILGGGKGLVLKGAPEKPTLVARPPALPTPVKSPWATLPPVNKTPPVSLDGTGSQPPARNQPREPPLMRGVTPPAAKEIAADDFSRSNGPVNPNRELFNSQSGRYEPVTERRGSGRNDPHQRHPASVLQRPSHLDGPPGPSPAFQSSRVEQESPYGRRRGSSNVSGGSGSIFQRGPKPHDPTMPPGEHLQARRPSLASDSPVSPSGMRQGHGPVWQSRTSPYAPHAAPHPNAGIHERQNLPPMSQPQPPQGPTADEYELQKKLMAEKLQAARQRKVEEEAKAEAEKQKRIAAKLAALGPAPESKSAKQAAAKDAGKTALSLTTETYPSQAQEKQQTQDGTSGDAKSPLVGQGAEIEISAPPAGTEILPTGTQIRVEPNQNTDPNSKPSQDGKAASVWQGPPPAQPSRFSWGPTAGQPILQNVWGAPNNNRSLGNGTFNADLGRLPDGFPPNLTQINGPSVSGPGPIGPPNGTKAQPAQIPKPIAPPTTAAAGLSRGGNPADDDTRSRWAMASKVTDERMTADTRERIAQQQPELETGGEPGQEARPTYHDSWKPVKFDNEGRRIETKDRIQVVHGTSWKPSATAERGAPAVVSPSGPGSTTSPKSRTSRFFPVNTDGARSEEANRHRSPSPPPPDTDGHPAFDGDAMRPHVALPPSRPIVRLPPTMGRQPAASNATTGTAAPPTASFGWATPKPYQESQTRAPPGAVATSQSSQTTWQSRINDLLHDGKNASPNGRMAIDSTSRRAMDTAATQAHATVSLPGLAGIEVADTGSPTSKDMAEECFEEQEMGSLPAVRLPAVVPDAAWNPSPASARSTPKRMWISATTVEVLEENPQSFAFVCLQGMTTRKRVHLPSARSYSTSSRSSPNNNNTNNTSSSSSSPRGSRGSGPRTHTGRGGNGNGNSNGNTPRSRETSTPFPNEGSTAQQFSSSGSGSLPTAPSGRGRGSFRRAADWGSRRTSTPLQT